MTDRVHKRNRSGHEQEHETAHHLKTHRSDEPHTPNTGTGPVPTIFKTPANDISTAHLDTGTTAENLDAKWTSKNTAHHDIMSESRAQWKSQTTGPLVSNAVKGDITVKKNLQHNEAILEDEKTKLEEKETKLEEKETKLEYEKTKLEEKKTKLEYEKTKLEYEKTKLEEKETKLEYEETKLEEKQTKLEYEKTKLKEKQTKLEEKETKLEEKEERLTEELRKAEQEGWPYMIYKEDLNRTKERRREVRTDLTNVAGELKGVMKLACLQEQSLGNVRTDLTNVAGELKGVRELLTYLQKQSLFGHFKIVHYTYERDVKMEQLANYLRTQPTDKKECGVEVTKLPCIITPDTNVNLHLVTRNHSRGVCKSAVSWLSSRGSGYRAVITGSPGIGKTWNLVYILQYLLLLHETVLLASRKDRVYVLFEPRQDGSYSAKSCVCGGERPVLDVGENVWVLVDPKESGNDIDYAKGKLILVSSPKRKHYHNWEKDGSGFFYMVMWTLEELLVAMPFMIVDQISEKLLRERYRIVGGAPRYIFSKEKFVQRYSDMDRDGLRTDLVLKVLQGSLACEIEHRGRHLPTLFLAYSVRGIDQATNAVDYMDSRIQFTSHHAMVRLIHHVIAQAFDEVVLNADKRLATFYGATFEDLVCVHLLSGGKFKSKPLDGERRNQEDLTLAKAEPQYVSGSSSMLSSIGNYIHMAETGSSGKSAKREFLIAPNNFAIADFADSHGRLFNATTNTKHTLPGPALRDLLGHCTQGEKPYVVNLFWCVPDTRKFQSFSKPSVPDDISHCIKQHVLWIPRARVSCPTESEDLGALARNLTK